MKKYTVTQSSTAVQTWTFNVEAESEEQALKLAQSGDIDPDDYTVETIAEFDDNESTWEVEGE